MFPRPQSSRSFRRTLAALALLAGSSGAAKTEWRLDAGSAVSTAPAVGKNGIAYVGTGDGSLDAVDADGVLKWSYSLDGVVATPPVIDAMDRVYLATTAGFVDAFLPSGIRAWQVRPPVRPVGDFSLASFGLLFGGSDGSVWAMSFRGAALWHAELREDIGAGPVAHGSRIIVGGLSGNVVFSDGAAKRFTAHLGGAVRGAPVVFADGSAAVLADGQIYRLDARAKLRWHHDGVTWMIAGGASLLAIETDGDLVDLRDDGSVQSRTRLGASVSGAPAASSGGFVYVPSDSGELLVVHPNGSIERVPVAPTPLHRPILDLARHRIVVTAGGGTVAAVRVDE